MKSKGLMKAGLLFLVVGLVVLTGWIGRAQARVLEQDSDETRGALLYDNWYAALGVQPPQGNMPIWERQTTNTRSGAETWRCVSCHGWDYQGKDGAYREGSDRYTGFPGLYPAVAQRTEEEIVALLSGKNDPQHDFSPYIPEADLKALAHFLKTALVNDNEYIDPKTLKVLGGDPANGKSLYESQCARCHGADGSTLTFRFEGRDATLGTLALLDPWRFLHKTRFGTPGTEMVIGYELGWTAQQGRDVLLYAQSLPSGLEPQQSPSLGETVPSQVEQPGGPARNVFTGVLTAFGALFTGLGFALILGVFLIGVLFVIVWMIRGKKQ
ncbi:c-type cytochrome [Anaerolinea sp.]|uniref:c-type cytochrome n=1 Tax=Anaerolinea sp. TaxID=1872519 RepID=UPI002ACD40A8|nr:c-type cytochrome [Anaerolinea sp.]